MTKFQGTVAISSMGVMMVTCKETKAKANSSNSMIIMIWQRVKRRRAVFGLSCTFKERCKASFLST